MLTGDRDRLIQVVINLISNAVKFTDAGSVTCRARLRDDTVVVSVVDTGMGITPADQPKVFERFKQVGDTLTDKPKGTGLGLPICKEIVEHHGGPPLGGERDRQGQHLLVRAPGAEPERRRRRGGRRARRAGTLELAGLIRQLRDQVTVTTPSTGDRPPQILVVDDDPNIRELLTQELTEAGYRVSVAGNGRAAVDAVRADRPDLVVLDVMMPELNGFDVAAVLKSDPATMDIPIVILSIVQDRERGFRVGVDRYLTKPIDTDLLFREVGSLLERRTSRKRVLVVDDDETTVESLSAVLTARGYSVAGSNGADLRERAMALQPDIIVLNSITSARSSAVPDAAVREGDGERSLPRLRPRSPMDRKILIVDDEAHLRTLIQQTLEELEDEGVEMLTATNGEEAIAAIESARPNLVFLDVMMPKLSGFDVCSRAKHTLGLKDVYVVLLTAKGQEFDRQRGQEVGADLYMTKPFDPDALLQKARDVLGL